MWLKFKFNDYDWEYCYLGEVKESDLDSYAHDHIVETAHDRHLDEFGYTYEKEYVKYPPSSFLKEEQKRIDNCISFYLKEKKYFESLLVEKEKERLTKALNACIKVLESSSFVEERNSSVIGNTALFCAKEALKIMEDDLFKASRWLGFIQGVLYSLKLSSIDELKEMNRLK